MNQCIHFKQMGQHSQLICDLYILLTFVGKLPKGVNILFIWDAQRFGTSGIYLKLYKIYDYLIFGTLVWEVTLILVTFQLNLRFLQFYSDTRRESGEPILPIFKIDEFCQKKKSTKCKVWFKLDTSFLSYRATSYTDEGKHAR